MLVPSVGDQLGDNVHEGGPPHPEMLQPLLNIPCDQDNVLPLLPSTPIPGLLGPQLPLSGLEVVSEHPEGHGIQDGLVLIGHDNIIDKL